MKLQNKNIIITGASQGLGKELAIKLTREGAQVILIARSEKLLQDLKTQIISEGNKAEYFVCDIRNLENIKTVVKKILDKYQALDILINNAGIWTDNNLEQTDPGRRKTAFETNTLGNINFTNEILPLFKKQNYGYIFNVISTAGAQDTPSGDNKLWQTYGASKWALTGFTKALRDSLVGTKIKVSGFFPGGFNSNLYENANRKNPHNQPWMMKTTDVAEVILFALTRPDDVLLESIIVTKFM